jgi:SAM-dependent methyltransferase
MTHSLQWRSTFGRVDSSRTTTEVAFIERLLPLPGFRRVLDVPCGFGRHMRHLARDGYTVVGIDSDESVVREAERAGLDARVGDMRHLPPLGRFDAVICMWASFGYFDHATNERILREFSHRLRVGGRLLIDIYNPDFFVTHQGRWENKGVVEDKIVSDGGRLQTTLVFPDGTSELHEWQLYDAGDLASRGRKHGLVLRLACGGFALPARPSASEPRMQLLFERELALEA